MTRMTTYIVDYDLPLEPAAKRVQFYRRLKKLIEEKKKSVKRSTDSVVITTDEGLARQIYNLAEQYGEANMYKVSSSGKDSPRGNANDRGADGN